LNAGHYIDLLKDYRRIILEENDPDFSVPVKLTNEYNSTANRKLRELANGETDFKSVKFSGLVKYQYYQEDEEVVVDKNSIEKKIKTYRVFFTNLNTYASGNFLFGARCLKEYVTHILQTTYYPDIAHPDIPYVIAEQIILKECPNFPDEPLFRVAICDACLMNLYPPEFFFKTLNRINELKFSPKSTDEIYSFVYSDITFIGHEQEYQIDSLLSKINTFTKDQIGNVLRGKNFISEKNWLIYLLDAGKSLRQNIPNFMTDLIESPGKLTSLCLLIFQQIGVPFFTNSNLRGGMVPAEGITPPNQAHILLAMLEILRVFRGATDCQLYKFCKNSDSGDITNDTCKSAPWKRLQEPSLCAFAQLWYSWGLKDKIPVKR